MYTFDEVIANGYFVFKEKLSTDIIMNFIAIRKNNLGEKFTRKDLKLNNLKNIVKFNNPYYSLVDGKTLTDLLPYIKPELIVIFQVIQESLENSLNQNSQDEKKYVKKI